MAAGRFPKSYADFVARLRVPAGFLLVAAFVYFSRPTARSLACGLPVSLTGLTLRAWASGHLAKNERLAVTGAYAYTRNPLYLGTLLVALGLVIAARRSGLAVLFGAVFVLIYLPVMELEEQHLRSLFPEYAAYAARVPALGWGRPKSKAAGSFQPSLYLKNQEYQALAGFLGGVLLLLWKAMRV